MLYSLFFYSPNTLKRNLYDVSQHLSCLREVPFGSMHPSPAQNYALLENSPAAEVTRSLWDAIILLFHILSTFLNLIANSSTDVFSSWLLKNIIYEMYSSKFKTSKFISRLMRRSIVQPTKHAVRLLCTGLREGTNKGTM